MIITDALDWGNFILIPLKKGDNYWLVKERYFKIIWFATQNKSTHFNLLLSYQLQSAKNDWSVCLLMSICFYVFGEKKCKIYEYYMHLISGDIELLTMPNSSPTLESLAPTVADTPQEQAKGV